MAQGEEASAAMVVPVEAVSPAEPWPPPPGKAFWFTLAALVVYRLGTYIPIPGINPAAFAESFKLQSSSILGMFNMFAGGAVERMAIFALNIMPYISASIIMQLMTSVVRTLEQLKEGRRAGQEADQPVHALHDRGVGRVPGLRHRLRA